LTSHNDADFVGTGVTPRRAGRIDPTLAEDIERRMAAMRVRVLCKEHDCQAPATGTCDDPMHRQKVNLTMEMLDMLGLPREYPAYTEEEQEVWVGWLSQSGPPDLKGAA
jgi:hypothetical protein